jgi:hypothetical protein
LFNDLNEFSVEKKILDIDENDKFKERTSIDYEDSNEVANLMAKHLSKIFVATHRKKISAIIDNM